MSPEWTLEDAPELHRREAMNYAAMAVNAFCRGMELVHAGQMEIALVSFPIAEVDSERAADYATRYRDARRAAQAIDWSLHYFFGGFLTFLHEGDLDAAAGQHRLALRVLDSDVTDEDWDDDARTPRHQKSLVCDGRELEAWLDSEDGDDTLSARERAGEGK